MSRMPRRELIEEPVVGRHRAELRSLVQACRRSGGELDGGSLTPRPTLAARIVPQPRRICLTPARFPRLPKALISPARPLGAGFALSKAVPAPLA